MIKNLFKDDCTKYNDEIYYCDCDYDKYDDIDIEIGRKYY